MTSSVRLAPDAQRHIDQVASWLQAQAPEQVDRFYQCLAEAVTRIADFPHLGHPADDGLRRLPMKVFRYQLWYVLDEREAVVVAVTHPRQDASSVLRDLGQNT